MNRYFHAFWFTFSRLSQRLRPYLLLLIATSSSLFATQTQPVYSSGRGLEQSCPTKREYHSLTFSPDGQYVAATWGSPANAKIQIWEVQSGKSIAVLAPPDFNELAFSKDNEYLALLAGPDERDNQLEVWNIQSGERVRAIRLERQQYPPIQLSFASDNRYLFSSDNTSTIEWDTETGKAIQKFTPAPDLVSYVFMSPDSGYLAEAGETAFSLWDIAANKQLLSLKESIGDEKAVAFSMDSKLIYIGASTRLIVWDIEKGTELVSLDSVESGGYRGRFSPDNKYLVTNSAMAFGDLVVVLSLETGKKVYTYKPAGGGGVYPVQFSADSQHLLLVDIEHDTTKLEILRIIDFRSGKELSKVALNRAYLRAFSADARLYFSVDDDGATLRVWNVATGKSQIWC
jgi:WD40 repeat protein